MGQQETAVITYTCKHHDENASFYLFTVFRYSETEVTTKLNIHWSVSLETHRIRQHDDRYA